MILALKFFYTSNYSLVTPSGSSIQHQTVLRPQNSIPEDEISCTLRITVETSASVASVIKGKHPCYIGCSTKIKHTTGPFVLVNPEPIDTSVMEIGELLNWIGEGPTMQCLLVSQENFHRDAQNRSSPALPKLTYAVIYLLQYRTVSHSRLPICPATTTPKQQMNKNVAPTPFLPVQLQWENTYLCK